MKNGFTGLGKWYEIARLPMWAQRICLRSTAEYTLLNSDKISVKNACFTTDGEETSINGIATVVDRTHHAKINVVFDQWVAKLVAFLTSSDDGNYWILRVDPEYRYEWRAHPIMNIYGSWLEHLVSPNPPTKNWWHSVPTSGSRPRT